MSLESTSPLVMRKGRTILISSAILVTSNLGFNVIEVFHMTRLLLEAFGIYLPKMTLYIVTTGLHQIHRADLTEASRRFKTR